MPPQTAEPLELFCSYAREDERLRESLGKHLDTLRDKGLIRDWHDGHITAGREWDREIRERLESARIILVLVSPDSLSSTYCDFEVARALERHEAGEARVIPVILRPCDWANTQLGKLNALPKAGRAVMLWANEDEALLNVVEGVRAVVEELSGTSTRPHAAPAAAAPKAPPPASFLRPPAVGFVSRRDRQGRDILERLREELSPERGGFVALWGPGGSGKTTLADEAVRALRPFFGGRMALVSALGRPDFSLQTLLDEIAARLGREDLRRAKPDDKAELVRALVNEAPTLVVLDNFETIKPEEQAACAAFVAECRCPALITTRVRVNRDEVTNVRLAAMEPDEAREFLRRLVENEEDPPAFAGLEADELIADCEANPLVMQWVVKQIVRSRRPQAVLEEIKRGEGEAAERVFTRSFDLLDEDARAALLALTLFAPDASRPALADVAGFGEDARRLDKSVAALSSLWLVETTAGNERFLLRGLTRSLARSRLAQDARAPEFRRRFVAHFLAYAQAHGQVSAEDFDALEAERDNLLGAQGAAFEAQDWQSALEMGPWLVQFLFTRGHWAEALGAGDLSLRAARSAGDEAAVARLAFNLAKLHHNRGDLAEAWRLYNESLEISKQTGNVYSCGATLHQMAVLLYSVGQVENARRLYHTCLNIMKQLGDERGVAQTLHSLALLAQNSGEPEEARRLYAESLEITKRLGDERGVAYTLHNLAMLAQGAGDTEEARRLYTESLAVTERLGDQQSIATTLHELGRLAQGEKAAEEARRLYAESLEIKRRLGDRPGIADTTSQLGQLHYELGEFAESKSKHEESLAIRRQIGEQKGISIDLGGLAALALAQGNLGEARRLYGESLEIEKQLGDQFGVAVTLNNLGLLAKQEGDKAEAARLFREALSIFERLGSPYAATTRENLASVEGPSQEDGG